jgi:hypothetical protein
MSVITKPETTQCKFMRAVDAIKAHPNYDAEDANQVASWQDGLVPAEHIALDLRRSGFPVSATIVKDHRRNVCACTVAI